MAGGYDRSALRRRRLTPPRGGGGGRRVPARERAASTRRPHESPARTPAGPRAARPDQATAMRSRGGWPRRPRRLPTAFVSGLVVLGFLVTAIASGPVDPALLSYQRVSDVAGTPHQSGLRDLEQSPDPLGGRVPRGVSACGDPD